MGICSNRKRKILGATLIASSLAYSPSIAFLDKDDFSENKSMPIENNRDKNMTPESGDSFCADNKLEYELALSKEILEMAKENKDTPVLEVSKNIVSKKIRKAKSFEEFCFFREILFSICSFN